MNKKNYIHQTILDDITTEEAIKMKKTLIKTLSLALTLLLALGCVALPAGAADTPDPVFADGGYLVIGDSISRGCGAEGFYLDRDGNPLPEGSLGGQYDIFEMRNVKGSFTTQIAEKLGYSMPFDTVDPDGNFWPLCYPGLTVSVLLDLMGIEDDFDDLLLDYMNYDWMLAYFGSEEYSKDGFKEGDDTKEAVIERFGGLGQVGPIDELVKKSNLITLELGMCDVFYRTYRIVSNGGALADGLTFDTSTVQGILGLVKTAISEMYNGYNFWKTWYPVVLDKLIEWNPDATIVLVGAFNLVDQMRITNEDAIPLGNIVDVLSDSMNRQMEKWADQRGDNVIYVDISNTETLSAENDWALTGDFLPNSFAGVHPTQNGHNYIAGRILNALQPEDNGKNIVVDLARFDRLDYVLVNGIKVTDYTLDGTVITIPCDHILATNLTIGVRDENGALAIQTYCLKYSRADGYTAKRVYGTNDLEDTVNKNRFLYRLLKLLFDKIVGFINQLFGKAG